MIRKFLCSLLIGGALCGQLLAQTPHSDWAFDQQEHQIQLKKKPKTMPKLLVLKFNQSNSALLESFKQPEERGGAYAKPLRINGTLFTGELEGRDAKGKLAFQVLLKAGLRYGEFLYVDAQGKTQRVSPKIEVPTPMPPMVKKPVLYLYPTAPTEVNIRIKNGQNPLTHTYPKCNPETGWQVLAQPNGDLLDKKTKKQYYALFWEAEQQEPYRMDKGFCVAGAQTAEFLEQQLTALGLSFREANEFIMFWLPQMENNPYNLVHFATDAYAERFPLEISPKPDRLIRVCMVFQPLESPVNIPAQQFQTPERKGFTVVEWGGIALPKPNN